MIHPFAVVPIKFPPEATEQKTEYLRCIIGFWQRCGALHHDEENSSYVKDAIRGTSLTSFLKMRTQDFKHKIDTLPNTSTKVSLTNTSEVREKMENGSKELRLCFINDKKVLVREKNIIDNPKNGSRNKYIVNEIDIKKIDTHDFGDMYLDKETFIQSRDPHLIEKLTTRWSAWLRYMVPDEKRDYLKIALFDPYLDNKNTFNSLSWVLHFINENVQFKVELSLYSIGNQFEPALQKQLNDYKKIKKVTVYYGSPVNARGTTRHLRVEDTVMCFDHLPSINKPESLYSEHFHRVPLTVNSFKKQEEVFRTAQDERKNLTCKSLVIKNVS